MRQIIYSIIALLLTNSCLLGQKSLSKAEILKHWIHDTSKEKRGSSWIDHPDSMLNVRLTALVDSLNQSKIDSILIFSTAWPGYISTSKCDTGIFPITTFVIWNDRGLTSIRKIRGQCRSEMVKDSRLQLFDSYAEHQQKLDSEIFVPVITSGQINKNKTVTY